MNKIIYFAIQTKSRELDEKLLLSYYALKKGYRVIIGRNKYIEKTFLKNNYGIVYNRIQYATENNVKKTLFVSHDDEGLVFNIETKSLRRNLDGRNYKPNIIITWGLIQKNLYLEDYPQFRDRIYSLGSPRFDLINKPYVTYFTHNTIKRINRFKDFVLINTNFALFNLDSWYGFSIEEFANKYIEPKRSEALKGYQFEKEIIPIYIRAIKKLAKERPNLNFILRPHPSENLTYWKNHFKRSDNIHVIYEYQSNDWINQAKLVIHTNCTTGIEATVLKKPVIRFLPKMKNSEVFNTASYFGIELDEKGLYKKFDEILENQSTSNDLDILSKYLENTYITNSAKKIMDLVTKKYEERLFEEEQKLKLNVSNLIIDMLYEIRYFLMKRDFLVKILPKKIVKKVTKGKKLGRISRTEIIKKMNLFNKIQETDFDYKVKKIAPDTFIISTKD